MPETTGVCAAGIETETLSALRDELLPASDAARLREHVPSCAACQARVAAFDEVARALLRQRELEPGDRILRGVRRRAAEGRGMRALTRRRVWSGLGALASVAAVLLLFIYVFGQQGGRGAGPLAGTPPSTRGPSATTTTSSATSTPASGPYKVSDAAIARQLNIAYVQNDEVWIGVRGAQPVQVTHLSLPPQNRLDWRLIWSDDGSKLLAVANDNPPAQVTRPRVWIIATSTGSVTDAPSLGAADLSLGCGQACWWLGDRYIVHVNPNLGTPHSQQYEVYDTQTQRDISTALDKLPITELEVRGNAVYFSGYSVSQPPTPSTIDRFDIATNSITAGVFTTPAALVSEGIPVANWDISADGSKIVYLFGSGLTTHCPNTVCYTYYQDASGTYALFPGYQSQAADGVRPLSDLVLSPDGRTAAVLFGTNTGTPAGATQEDILQQGTPSGGVGECGVSSGNSQGWIAGWTTGSPGVILEQPRLDGNGNTLSTSLYFAPSAGSGNAELIASLALPVNVYVSVAP